MQPKLFQVPSEVSNGSARLENAFIAVIDSSGSMGSYWAAIANQYNALVGQLNADVITITFSQNASLVSSNTLSTSIRDHGGTTTNISYAFNLLDLELARLPAGKGATILFISDGQDSSPNGLQDRLLALKGNRGRSISFLCLGVLSGFPTFISMTLREMYHTASVAIPAVFLIEHWSESAFETKMKAIISHVRPQVKVAMSPPVITLPWLPAQSTVDGGSVVCTVADAVTTTYPDAKPTSHAVASKLATGDMIGYTRALAQALDMQAISDAAANAPGTALRENAVKARELVAVLRATYEAQCGLPFGLVKGAEEVAGSAAYPNTAGSTTQWRGAAFSEMRNSMSIAGPRVDGFLGVIDLHAAGGSVGDGRAAEFEAAKRLNIGTLAGKHAQRVAALKWNTGERYTAGLAAAAEVAARVCVGTATRVPLTVGALLADETLGEVFAGMPNAVDLTMVLPLVGLPLSVRRDGFALTVDGWHVRTPAESHAAYVAEAESASAADRGLATANADAAGEIAAAAGADAWYTPIATTQLTHIMDSSYRVTLPGSERVYTGLLPTVDPEIDKGVLEVATSAPLHVLYNAAAYGHPDVAGDRGLLMLLSATFAYAVNERAQRHAVASAMAQSGTVSDSTREAAAVAAATFDREVSRVLPVLAATYKGVYGKHGACVDVAAALREGNAPAVSAWGTPQAAFDGPLPLASVLFIGWVVATSGEPVGKLREAVQALLATHVAAVVGQPHVAPVLALNARTTGVAVALGRVVTRVSAGGESLDSAEALATNAHVVEALEASASLKHLRTQVEQRVRVALAGGHGGTYAVTVSGDFAGAEVGRVTLRTFAAVEAGHATAPPTTPSVDEAGGWITSDRIFAAALRAANSAAADVAGSDGANVRGALVAELSDVGASAVGKASAVVDLLLPTFVRTFVAAHRETLPIANSDVAAAALAAGVAPTRLVVDPQSHLGLNFCSARECKYFAQPLPDGVSWRAHLQTWAHSTSVDGPPAPPLGFHAAVRAAVEVTANDAEVEAQLPAAIQGVLGGADGAFARAYLAKLIPAYRAVLKSNASDGYTAPSEEVIRELRRERRRQDAPASAARGRGHGRGGRGGRGGRSGRGGRGGRRR